MEQNVFNPIQREFLINEIEKINKQINLEEKYIRTARKNDNSDQYNSLALPRHEITMHVLEERKILVENLLKANNWIYIDHYSASMQSLKNYEKVKKDNN